MATITCAVCGHVNAADQKFCVSCGSGLAVQCPNCGHTNPPAARFCGNCGTQLASAPASQPEEERRLVTVVFADISGFTSHSRDRDPEEVTAMVDACMAKLSEIVSRYGGTVDKVIGDALMAVFGAPLAHEDDPERAVRAALEMQACAAEALGGFENLELRVGVNTGEVMYAPVGPARDAFTVMGDTVNVAQRLQAGAARGGVLVGAESFRATAPAVRYGDPVAVVVKDGEAPIQGWPILEATDAPGERRGSTGPMVGRDRELARLRDAWEQIIAERQPQLITIFGPPGIGKTTLAREFVDRVEADGGRGLVGRSLPYGEKSGYRALVHQLRKLAGIFETDSVDEARKKLDGVVTGLVDSETCARLAVLAGLSDEESIGSRDAIFYSARRLVEALGRERPTVLVFEDVHWADVSLLDLVEDLAEKLRDVPVLILTLARPELRESRPKWGGGLETYASLRLEPLGTEDAKQLVKRLLGDADREAVSTIVERAEGNPLFAEELVAAVEEGRATNARELPTSIKGIVAARIDALPADERVVVHNASVVGRTFWRGLLQSLGSNGAKLDAAIDELQRRDLIRQNPTSMVEGDEEFSFKHMLIRDVAYETLPKARRRERHAAVARFIEQASGDRIAESAATLAHHWQLAGDEEQAFVYLVQAAKQAHRTGAKIEAVSLLEQALALHSVEDESRRRSVRLQRATILVELGDFEPATAELDKLLQVLAGRELFEAIRSRTLAANWQMQVTESMEFGERAFELAEELGGADIKALALGLRAFATAMLGRIDEATELDEQALGIWPRGAYESERSETMAWAGIHQYWIGNYDRAIEHSRAGHELGLKRSNVYGLVAGGSHEGLALAGLGRHEEAIAVLEQTASDGRELEGKPIFTSRLVNILAGTYHELYEIDEARRLNEEAIELGNSASFSAAVMSGRIDLLFSDLVLGEVGSAEAAWPALWDAAEASKGWHQWLWMTRLARAKAEIALAAGRLDDALDAALVAVEQAVHYRRPKYSAASRLVLADTLSAVGRTGEALREVRTALAEAEKLGHPPSIWQAALKVAQLCDATGDDEGAGVALEQARGTVERFAHELSPDRRERFLQAPQVAAIFASAR